MAARGAGAAAGAAGDCFSWRPALMFYKGLNEMGYVEGRDVAIDVRGADQYDQLLALAADLVRRKVAQILGAGRIPPFSAGAAASGSG